MLRCHLRAVLRLGQIIFSTPFNVIRSKNPTGAKVGRKIKLASCTLKKGRPKKVHPIEPTSEHLMEIFKGLKLNQKPGKFTKNGRRIVA